ncbi:Dysbindin Biogenesis of lysosome-related organelles complex 1 subunit 8 [Channa argus]|uniref:Dysbindin Biogenesis of lysosome-related organelles complex 1 subunit 8 n=1 Tax=Channa argus TaxID=215402 RepID=A0A6G1QYY0_CHAAH|nr:Dysbindin Biogenesis of lysosome-related organelles complex 1 subunit 8 [Channa argus]
MMNAGTDGPSNTASTNSVELDAEHPQRLLGAEQGGVPTPQVKLKDRQKFFEEAFQQDMEQYLSTGYLQIAERRGEKEEGILRFVVRLKSCHPMLHSEPIGSMSSMEVNVDMLEQMDLMDMSDHEALDVFLHSGGEDNSAASPVTGPDVESFTTEISLQVPTQAELRHKLSSLSSTCTDSASQDTEVGEEEEDDDDEEETEQGGGGVGGSGGGGRRRRPPVVVTRDEEEVQPDTALVESADQEGRASKDCEESRPKV